MDSIKVIPKPGKRGGPCDGLCQHLLCHEQRVSAKCACVICGREIGYDTRYLRKKVFAHLMCVVELVGE